MPVDAHLYITSDNVLSDEFISTLAAHLAEDMGHRIATYHGRGYIYKVEEEDFWDLPEHLPHATTVLRLHTETPYYGPGYERGHWPDIGAILEFLWRRVRNGQVWYGRDDGHTVSEVTRESLDALWSHWAEHGGRPYYQRSGR